MLSEKLIKPSGAGRKHMSREQDAKIAEWLGFKLYKEKFNNGFRRYWSRWPGETYTINTLPHYTTSDTDAISLFPVLADREYTFDLSWTGSKVYDWTFGIYKNDKEVVWICKQPTIAAAISSAVLQLIESERGGEE